MDVNIKLSVGFTVNESSLEDALAEFDELSVAGLLREIIDNLEGLVPSESWPLPSYAEMLFIT